MEKRKVVVKVTMNNEKKTRKALEIAVSICGVDSASFVGSDKDQIEVTGKVDPVKLAKSLRKSIGCTEIVSVEPVSEKNLDAPDTQPQAMVVPLDVYPPPHYYGAPYRIFEAPPYNNPTCMIL